MIKTFHTSIRKLTEQDFTAVFSILSKKVNMAFMDIPVHTSEKQTQDWIKEVKELEVGKTTQVYWAIVNEENKLIGVCGLSHIIWKHKSSSISFLIDKEYQGKGWGKKVLRSIISLSFNQLKLHRLEAQAHQDNLASMGLLLNEGFVKEGVMKENFLIEGEFYDSHLFALINK